VLEGLGRLVEEMVGFEVLLFSGALGGGSLAIFLRSIGLIIKNLQIIMKAR